MSYDAPETESTKVATMANAADRVGGNRPRARKKGGGGKRRGDGVFLDKPKPVEVMGEAVEL